MQTQKFYSFKAVCIAQLFGCTQILGQGPYLTTLTVLLNCFMKSKTSSLLKNPTAGTYLEPAESSEYLDLSLVIRKSSTGVSARRSDVLMDSVVFLSVA